MRRRVVIAAISALVLLVNAGIAEAASARLYVLGDSTPAGSMSLTSPEDMLLPDYDGGGAPGLLLKKTDKGARETDPTKYQQWRYDLSGTNATIGSFTIWTAPKDFDDEKTVRFLAHVLSCQSECEVVGTSSRQLQGGSSWKPVTLSFGSVKHTFDEGESLVVKITVSDDSDDDMWFAYGSQDYPASLRLSNMGAPTTTTTTTTTPPPTSTTNPPTTTTTTQPTTTTTTPPPTSTTNPPTTTTTEGERSALVGTGPKSGPGGPRGPQVMILSTPDPSPQASGTPEDALLRPQEGLMVIFSTAAENIGLYWQVALGLGCLMAVLLLIGVSRNSRDEPKPGTSSRFADIRLRRLR